MAVHGAGRSVLNIFGVDALMVGQRAVTPWLRRVGSIPTHITSFRIHTAILNG